MTPAEQSLYQTHGLAYALGGSENQAILDALVSAVGGRRFEDLTPSMQASLKAILASASTSLGVGPTVARSANFNTLYQGAMSGGIGYAMSAGSNLAALTPAMAATLAASHISSRLRVTDDGISQATASGLSETTIDGMLGEMMRSGAVKSDTFRQRRVKNIDELMRLAESGEDGYSLSREQKVKYRRMKDMRDELAVIDSDKEKADAMQKQAEESGKQEDRDRAQEMRDKVTKATKKFQEKYSDSEIQELKTIESGSLAVTMSADKEMDAIKKHIRGSADVLKKMSGIFGTENFADLQKYAKQLGVNTLSTARGVQEMENVIKRAQADANLYGMSVQQVLQNQTEARAGLANVWGGEQYVPIWAQEQVGRAALAAQANEQFGIDAGEITAKHASRQADYIAHGRDLNAYRYQLSKMDLSNPETASAAQEMLSLIEQFKAAPTDEKERLRKAIKEIAGQLSLSDSESIRREAELNGYSGKDIAASLTRHGVDENIEANIKNAAPGSLETIYNEVSAGGMPIDQKGVIDTVKTMVHMFGGMGAGGKQFNEFRKAMREYKNASTPEEREKKKAKVSELLQSFGASKESVDEMWDTENGNYTLEALASSDTLMQRVETVMRLSEVSDFEGDTIKLGKQKDAMRRLVTESESADSLKMTGKSAGDIVTQFARGVMASQDLTQAQLVRAAATGGIVSAAGVSSVFANLDKEGKLHAKKDKEGNVARDSYGDVIKELRTADGGSVTKEQMIEDAKTLSPEKLKEKYGEEIGGQLAQQRATAASVKVDEYGNITSLGDVDAFLATHQGKQVGGITITDKESLNGLIGQNINEISGIRAAADAEVGKDGMRNVTFTTAEDTQTIQDAAQGNIEETYGFSGGEMEKFAKEGLFKVEKETGAMRDSSGGYMLYDEKDSDALDKALHEGGVAAFEEKRKKFDEAFNKKVDEKYNTGGDATMRTIARLYETGHFEEAARMQQEAERTKKLTGAQAKDLRNKGRETRAERLMAETKKRYSRFGGGWDSAAWIARVANAAGEKLKKGNKLTADEASNLLWAATGEQFYDGDKQTTTSTVLEKALGKKGAKDFFTERDAKDGITVDRVREIRQALENIDERTLKGDEKKERQYLLDQFRAVEDNLNGNKGVSSTGSYEVGGAGAGAVGGVGGIGGNTEGLMGMLQEAVTAITNFTKTAERLITSPK